MGLKRNLFSIKMTQTTSLIVVVLCVLNVCSVNFSEAQLSSFPGRNGNDNDFKATNRQKIGTKSTSPSPPLAPHPIYDFARNLFLTATDLSGARDVNVLISPFSIRAVTALIYLGSKGKTAQEIGEALQFSSDPDRIITGLGKHMQQTHTMPGQNFVYKVGNGVFIKSGVSLNRNYADTIRQKLESSVNTVDFTSPQKAAKQINNWVANITNNKIQDIVNSDILSPQTSVFLANALFFSGQWEKPFDASVPAEESQFEISPGQFITVPMMQIESTFGYTYLPKLKATGISIPFKDQRFEFLIVKPDKDLEQLENLMRDYPLNTLPLDMKANTRNVVLKMPKFKLDVNYDLVEIMKKLGVTTLFDSEKADLTGLTKGGERHVVSQIIHQTSLDIDENGAVAAAATGVGIYPISSPSIFGIDKPFFFMINDRLTGPVLIGHLTNPLQQYD